MKTKFLLVLIAAASILISCKQQVQQEREEWAIVLHGGAGGSHAMSTEDEAAYCIFLNEALEQGKRYLSPVAVPWMRCRQLLSISRIVLFSMPEKVQL